MQQTPPPQGQVVSLIGITPDTEALRLLSSDEAYAYRVLPFGWYDNALLVAASRPLPPEQQSKIRRRVGRSVRPYLCSDAELETALAEHYGTDADRPHAAGRIDPLLLVRALDLVTDQVLRRALGAYAREREVHWLTRLQEAGHLTAQQITALRAGAHAYPHLRTPRFEGHPGLALILSAETAAKWKAVPFFSDARRLWVFTPAGDPITDTIHLGHTIGLHVRPVVVDDPNWQFVYDRLYTEPADPTPAPIARDTLLNEGHWLSATRKARLQLITKHGDVSPATVVRRRGWLNDRDWQALEAERWELLPAMLRRWAGTPLDDAVRTVRFSRTLGSRWNIVPLYVADDGLHVGMCRPDRRRMLPAVAALSGQAVHGHLLTEQQFNRAWHRYYDVARVPAPLPTLGEWLRAGAYASPDQIEEAAAHAREHDLRLGESLLTLGYLDTADLAEVLSLQGNQPWFPLEHVPAGLSPERRQALAYESTALPLLELRTGDDRPQSILVAVSDPFVPLIPSEEDSALSARVHRLVVPAPIIEAARAPTTADAGRYDDFLHYLVRYGHLKAERVPALLERWMQSQQPFDRVLTAEALDADTYYSALAAFTDLPRLSLDPTYEQETFIDAVGRVLTGTIADDPVSPAAARHISVEDARRWSALPIARQESRLTVAVVDPFDQNVRNEVEAAVAPLVVQWAIAPRASVQAAIARTIGRKHIGTYLLEAGEITPTQLKEALELAHRVGVRIGRALTVLGHVQQETLVAFLSVQQNVPYFDLSDPDMIDVEVASLLSERDARRWGALPVAAGDEYVTVAMIDPLDSEARGQIEAVLERPVVPVITTERDFERALEALYQDEYTYRSTQDLVFRYPDESAFQVLSRGQKLAFGVVAAVGVFWLLWDYVSCLIAFNALTTAFYLAFSVHRFYLVYRALSHDLEIPVSAEEVAGLDDRDLPFYTILVPLYREAAVLPALTRAIIALDYPLAKLDVKLLMEEDDTETIEAARALGLPSNFQHVIVPNSEPKTKPKACNYGLIKARGDYVVIFDAEDLPERDQLKKIIVAFDKVGDDVACIQAKLNYYNRQQNLLTRWFTTEYSMWFDLFLPGLDASNAPVPLGGTSNHFRRDRLEALGAWDPFNVTEDADLGVRLFKAGYRTAIVDTTTFEEANSELTNWVRQRSRWVKGYIQTWLVHMRHPVALWRTIGTNAFASFNLVIGGTFIGYLLNPLYWGLTALWFLTEWGLIQEIFPAIIFYLGGINLYLGNFVFTYMNVAGTMRRGFYDMVKYALLSPIYWALMSVGAWKGFIQLIHKPFYWEKTVHGLYGGTPNVEEARELKDLV